MLPVLLPVLLAVVLAAVLAAGLVGGARRARADGTSPVGVWRTFSDRDGRESGAVEIFADGDVLDGRVVAIRDPAKRAALCRYCDGDRHGLPVLGLEILRGMRRDGARWDGGHILDPENGDTYRCILRLEEGGQVLVVRGFIGIALLGRTQRWVRQQ